MIPYKLREFLARFTLSRFMEKPRKNRVVEITAPKSIAVFVSPSDAANPATIRESAAVLLKHFGGVDLNFYTYTPKIKKDVVYSERYLQVLDPEDVNWYLKPLNMKPAHADILLDFTRKPHIPLRFFTLFSKSRLRAGVTSPWNEGLLDIQFDVTEKFELTYVCGQFIHYFELLKDRK
ncbi:MAG: hypothetical protein KDC37_02395 [Flavobacteriales bacterium]|nr:hypothetical protein [Flavobacteriales bacterium]